MSAADQLEVVVEDFRPVPMAGEKPRIRYGYKPAPGLVKAVADRPDRSTWFGKRAHEKCAAISPLGRRALRFHLTSQSVAQGAIERMEQ
jgi:hypothetical protein